MPDSSTASISIYYIRFVKLVAYSIRIMLSHIRIKRSAFNKLISENKDAKDLGHPPELQRLYALISSKVESAPEPNIQPGRAIANPFMSFRQAEASDDEGSDESAHDDDEAVCV